MGCFDAYGRAILTEGSFMRIFRAIRQFVPIMILAVFVCRPAPARDKTDILVLKNGNEITGEIREMSRGYLSLKTDSMSTVQIKWQDVDKITSKHLFAVELSNGRIFEGSLQPGSKEGTLDVVGTDTGRDLYHLWVVEIREVEKKLWQRFSGSVSLGYTYTKASQRTQFNLNSDLGYRAESYEGNFSYETIISSSNGTKDANKSTIKLAGSRYFSGKWLFFTGAKLEHNLELELDIRTSVSVGPGYRFLRTHQSEIMLKGGLSYSHERYFEQDATNNAEGFATISVQFFKLYSPKVDLTNEFSFFPNLTTSGRFRTDFSSNLRIEVFRNFFVNFSFYDNYDSKPPSETATKHDYGFVTGVSWSFRR